MIVFIFHAFRLVKVFLLFNSVVSFLSIAREARVDLRSPAPEAKPRSGKRGSRTGEGGNISTLQVPTNSSSSTLCALNL